MNYNRLFAIPSNLRQLLPHELLLLQGIPFIVYCISSMLYVMEAIALSLYSFFLITSILLSGWFAVLFIISVIRFIRQEHRNKSSLLRISIFSVIAIIFVTAMLLFIFFFGSLAFWFFTSP
jgi:uncharacterized protein YybS (DUF2232 family)